MSCADETILTSQAGTKGGDGVTSTMAFNEAAPPFDQSGAGGTTTTRKKISHTPTTSGGGEECQAAIKVEPVDDSIW